MELGAPCLGALDTVWTNLSALWGPSSGWRERWALKRFCQGFERGPGFFFSPEPSSLEPVVLSNLRAAC